MIIYVYIMKNNQVILYSNLEIEKCFKYEVGTLSVLDTIHFYK